MNYTNRYNLRLNPDPDGLGGGAAADSSPAGGAAPAAADSGASAPQFDPNAFKSELQNFIREELGGVRQVVDGRFREFDSRLPKPEQQAPKADKAPQAEDYDFTKPGEFERFMDERSDYLMEKKLEARESKSQQTQREQGYRQYVQSVQDQHFERADSFRAANPDYDPNKPVSIGNDDVTLAVMESEFSAHIHNYLQKNPAKVAEIRKLSTAAAIRAIGRIESQFEAQAAVVEKNKTKLAPPTANAFGGTSKADGQPDMKKLREFYN